MPGLQEVGPYGIGWERRKHTWTERSNILFIDNPVGTGFSYVEEGTNLSTWQLQTLSPLNGFYGSDLHEGKYATSPVCD